MKWIFTYWHEWSGNTTYWEEALVLPDSPEYSGQALHVSVSSLEYWKDVYEDSGRLYQIALTLLEGQDRWCRADDYAGDFDEWEVIMNTHKFTLDQFANALKEYLLAQGIAADEMELRDISEFAGRHPLADTVIELMRQYPAENE